MTITVKYFASLREKLAKEQEEIVFSNELTVAELWQQLNTGKATTNVLVAINLNQVSWETLVNDGDEVAFFPPVTGG